MNVGIGHNRPPRSVSEIKEAILFNRSVSERGRRTDAFRHRVDRQYSDYLGGHPTWARTVYGYLRELKRSGERVVYADICGRSTAVLHGVDISYCFSLQASWAVRATHPKQDVIVDGDLFSMKDFNSFIALMREKGDRPAYVTFEPIAGLQGYTPLDKKSTLHPQVTWQRLSNNLRRVIEVVRPGGYIFLARPFSLADPDLGCRMQFPRLEHKEYTSVKWIQEFCKGKKCSVAFERDITGMKFLLRKWESAK